MSSPIKGYEKGKQDPKSFSEKRSSKNAKLGWALAIIVIALMCLAVWTKG